MCRYFLWSQVIERVGWQVSQYPENQDDDQYDDRKCFGVDNIWDLPGGHSIVNSHKNIVQDDSCGRDE